MRQLRSLIVLSALAIGVSAGGLAWASPPGVSEKEGTFIAPDGKPLYTFARDMTAGKSSCNAQCAVAWPPLAAAADAKPEGDWSLIDRDDGTRQWAYKGKPLYTFAKDTPGKPATGVSAAWPAAVP